MNFTKTTEQSSKYEHLEKMSVSELLTNINNEDKTVPLAVEKALPQIESLVSKVVKNETWWTTFLYWSRNFWKIRNRWKLSECPPTFGVPFDW